MQEEQQEPNMENGKHLIDKRKKVDLDTILVEELGQFGPYQLRILLLAIVVVIFGAWAAVEYIFTTARINTRSAKIIEVISCCIFKLSF